MCFIFSVCRTCLLISVDYEHICLLFIRFCFCFRSTFFLSVFRLYALFRLPNKFSVLLLYAVELTIFHVHVVIFAIISDRCNSKMYSKSVKTVFNIAEINNYCGIYWLGAEWCRSGSKWIIRKHYNWVRHTESSRLSINDESNFMKKRKIFPLVRGATLSNKACQIIEFSDLTQNKRFLYDDNEHILA